MRRLLIAALLVTTLPAAPAHAWSQQSHMTTGAIAYDDLAANDPLLLPQVEEILKAHPHYDRLAAHAEGLTGAARTRVIFEWLARWADDVRETPMSKPEWHYELRVVSGRTWLWTFRNGLASMGFSQSFRKLSDPKAAAADRAIALGWLMHIVGDIQQPLHAGHRMTEEFPETDRAGGIAFVRKAEGGDPIELHEFWDKALNKPGAENATSLAWSNALQTLWPRDKIPELKRSGAAQVQFGKWLDESHYLAKHRAYTGTALASTADAEQAPVVTPFELRFTQELSKRRVATGGYRIADTIRMALK